MLSQVEPLTLERLVAALGELAPEVFVSARGVALVEVGRVLVRVENPADRAFALHMTARWSRILHPSRQADLRRRIEELNRERGISRLALRVADDGALLVDARLTHWVAPGVSEEQLAGWLSRGIEDLSARLAALDARFPEEEPR